MWLCWILAKKKCSLVTGHTLLKFMDKTDDQSVGSDVVYIIGSGSHNDRQDMSEAMHTQEIMVLPCLHCPGQCRVG